MIRLLLRLMRRLILGHLNYWVLLSFLLWSLVYSLLIVTLMFRWLSLIFFLNYFPSTASLATRFFLFVIIIWCFIYSSPWLFISNGCLRWLLSPIHRGCIMSGIILCWLPFYHLKLNVIVTYWPALPRRFNRWIDPLLDPSSYDLLEHLTILLWTPLFDRCRTGIWIPPLLLLTNLLLIYTLLYTFLLVFYYVLWCCWGFDIYNEGLEMGNVSEVDLIDKVGCSENEGEEDHCNAGTNSWDYVNMAIMERMGEVR